MVLILPSRGSQPRMNQWHSPQAEFIYHQHWKIIPSGVWKIIPSGVWKIIPSKVTTGKSSPAEFIPFTNRNSIPNRVYHHRQWWFIPSRGYFSKSTGPLAEYDLPTESFPRQFIPQRSYPLLQVYSHNHLHSLSPAETKNSTLFSSSNPGFIFPG